MIQLDLLAGIAAKEEGIRRVSINATDFLSLMRFSAAESRGTSKVEFHLLKNQSKFSALPPGCVKPAREFFSRASSASSF
jgi:hypothetical protein